MNRIIKSFFRAYYLCPEALERRLEGNSLKSSLNKGFSTFQGQGWQYHRASQGAKGRHDGSSHPQGWNKNLKVLDQGFQKTVRKFHNFFKAQAITQIFPTSVIAEQNAMVSFPLPWPDNQACDQIFPVSHSSKFFGDENLVNHQTARASTGQILPSRCPDSFLMQKKRLP